MEARLKLLTRTEEIILAAVWALQEDAYGIAINRFIRRKTGLPWKFGSIYTPLGRLVKNGYLITQEGEVTPKRGGRRKIYYQLTDLGFEALKEIKRINEEIWNSLPDLKTGD